MRDTYKFLGEVFVTSIKIEVALISILVGIAAAGVLLYLLLFVFSWQYVLWGIVCLLSFAAIVIYRIVKSVKIEGDKRKKAEEEKNKVHYFIIK
ncbi:hypothetical protein OA57_01710 [Chelonobacter oris]|uniref:Uncharacterized protein n=2 Tax=Chelonobacter oris TaxID=505317 RepID=A0A0A3BBR3_9PAST|nr:hypothetical protein OA57_01710 [Chelonobacter oris]